MASRKGFTLLEVVLVLVIIGALAAFVLPNIFVSIEQTNAQAARNNLLAMAAAQSKYDEDHGNYCVGGCANGITNIDTNLHLTITPGGSFSYSCPGASLNCSVYQCTAGDQSDTITLCVTNTGNGPQTNVSCALNAGVHGNLCPF